MRILVVCQHYWPEPYPLADICEELVRMGHSVHVVTGVPNYPMGYVYPAYKNRKNRIQRRNGVEITRTFTVGRRRNLVFRVLNYVSYALSSSWHIWRMKDEYDVVFANQTSPVIMSLAAIVYAKKWKKPCLLYCMDLWPASLTIAGIREKSLVYCLMGWISGFIYRAASVVLIASQGFREYLRDELGVADGRITYLPQFAEDIFSEVVAVGKSGEVMDLVFAGNTGKAQALPTILKTAVILRGEMKLRWHIVGDGQALEEAKNMAREFGLENVVFHGRKPVEEMPAYYAMADAMILCLTGERTISQTLPRKMQTYMAAGKPILASANGETARVMAESQCGFCVPAENEEAFAEAVRKYSKLTPDERCQMGNNAREYYMNNFSKETFFTRLSRCLSRSEYTNYANEIG